jgi:hypothetical protein
MSARTVQRHVALSKNGCEDACNSRFHQVKSAFIPTEFFVIGTSTLLQTSKRFSASTSLNYPRHQVASDMKQL